MSSRIILESHKEDFAHSIQDDMESMLYVILYCGLKWLPHNLHGNFFPSMNQFFAQESSRHNGKLSGGTFKAANQHSRHYTSRITFTCQAFQEWLTTVMNYNSPMRADIEEFEGKWDGPNHLYEFWDRFLQRHTDLPSNDRIDHYARIHPPRDDLAIPPSPTIPSSSS